jgi:hypothetical protein
VCRRFLQGNYLRVTQRITILLARIVPAPNDLTRLIQHKRTNWDVTRSCSVRG